MGSGFVGDDVYKLYDRPLFQKGNDENLVGIDKNEVVIEYQL